MKFRMLLPLFALLALLTVPVIGIAEEEAVKKEGEKCAKCEKGEKCEKGAKCEKGEKCAECEKGGGLCEKCSKCPLANLKCPISGKDIDVKITAAHHGGKVFFCCEKCLSAWNKDVEKDGEKKFVARANFQLVASRQAKQKGCPISGKATKDATIVKVGFNETKVSFCCDHCQKNAQKKEGADQVAMLFNEKSFAKAFEMVEQEKKETAVQ